MSRKRLGALDPSSVSTTRDQAEQNARERRGQAASKAPPIGQVAGSASEALEQELLALRKQADAHQEDALSFQAAKAEGRVVALIHVDLIDDHVLPRDRRRLNRDSEDWAELLTSIRTRGQQVPIEVTGPDPENGHYRLISGYRRLSALRALRDETGQAGFASVKALVTGRNDMAEAMVAMVEENEIRQDVSFYERGRICCLAAERGAFDSVDTAIQGLFASSSRNRRYKIRNFTVIHTQLGPFLDFPEQIGERLGGRLAQALKEGRGPELTQVLSDRDEKFTEPAQELQVLEAFVSQRGAFAKPADTPPSRQVLRATWVGQGVRAKATASGERITLELRGISAETEQDLTELIQRFAAFVRDR